MVVSKLKEEVANLKNQDTYSLILFVLFKLRDIPEYSTLSELIYILNKDGFLKLCEYFGGKTIKIPTISELEGLVNTLTLYQLVNIEKLDFTKAAELVGYPKREFAVAEKNYKKVAEVLEKYSLVG